MSAAEVHSGLATFCERHTCASAGCSKSKPSSASTCTTCTTAAATEAETEDLYLQPFQATTAPPSAATLAEFWVGPNAGVVSSGGGGEHDVVQVDHEEDTHNWYFQGEAVDLVESEEREEEFYDIDNYDAALAASAGTVSEAVALPNEFDGGLFEDTEKHAEKAQEKASQKGLGDEKGARACGRTRGREDPADMARMTHTQGGVYDNLDSDGQVVHAPRNRAMRSNGVYGNLEELVQAEMVEEALFLRTAKADVDRHASDLHVDEAFGLGCDEDADLYVDMSGRFGAGCWSTCSVLAGTTDASNSLPKLKVHALHGDQSKGPSSNQETPTPPSSFDEGVYVNCIMDVELQSVLPWSRQKAVDDAGEDLYAHMSHVLYQAPPEVLHEVVPQPSVSHFAISSSVA